MQRRGRRSGCWAIGYHLLRAPGGEVQPRIPQCHCREGLLSPERVAGRRKPKEQELPERSTLDKCIPRGLMRLLRPAHFVSPLRRGGAVAHVDRVAGTTRGSERRAPVKGPDAKRSDCPGGTHA